MKTYESCGMRVIISLIYFPSRHWFGECLRKNGCNFNILYSLLWILSIFHQPVTQHNFMNEFAFVHVFHCICGWRHLRKNVNLSSRYIEVVINIIILTTSKWFFSIQNKFYRRIFYDMMFTILYVRVSEHHLHYDHWSDGNGCYGMIQQWNIIHSM